MASFFKASLAGAILIGGLFTCQRAWDNPYNKAAYNTLPAAEIAVTRVPEVDGSTFIFDASGSCDIEDEPGDLQVRWDWESDGTWDTEWDTVKTDTHTYTTGGKKVVRVAVRDLDNGITDGIKELGVDLSTVTRLDSFVFLAEVDASPVAFAEGDLVRWDKESDGTWDTGWDSVLTDTFRYGSEGGYVIRLEIRHEDGRIEQVSTMIQALLHPGQVRVSGGSFLMGSDFENEPGNPFPGAFVNEMPVHSVTVSDFWMDTTEVTQDDFEALMGFNPSYNFIAGSYPVEQVTWFDAVLYCNARSKRDGLDTVYTYSGQTKTGDNATDLAGLAVNLNSVGYRLPTEAEWEYAARSGTPFRYCYGDSTDSLADYAWYQQNTAGRRPQPVATLKPNAFGLYDIHGNVFEWCQDWFDVGYYLTSPASDPPGPAAGTLKSNRSGSYRNQDFNVRTAQRGAMPPESSLDYLGFRVVLPDR